jgi:hypothetical protein
VPKNLKVALDVRNHSVKTALRFSTAMFALNLRVPCALAVAVYQNVMIVGTLPAKIAVISSHVAIVPSVKIVYTTASVQVLVARELCAIIVKVKMCGVVMIAKPLCVILAELSAVLGRTLVKAAKSWFIMMLL